MIFAIVIFLLLLLGFLWVLFWVNKNYASDDEQLLKNIEIMKSEQEIKQGLLKELAVIALGFVTKKEMTDVSEQLTVVQAELKAEQGRVTIAEAELEAVDVRLRELDEIKRELEMSGLDASRELELLRAQESDIASQNEALKNQLQNSQQQLEMLLSALATSAEAVEKLQNTKAELLEVESKTQFYEGQIVLLNQKYVSLKKAYDALDIEYAQLYEKQQKA